MSKVFLITLLLTFIEVSTLFSQTSSKATLEITFSGIRNSDGLIAIGINRSPEGWPREPHMDPNWKKDNLINGTMTVKIENLKYGTYAISVLDDENSNLEMDTFMGIPKEGYGFSRNAKVGISPPRFEECSFIIDQPLKKIAIEIRYMGKGK